MNKKITAPPFICKMAITSAICQRSTELVRKSTNNEISEKSYLAQQFPADAISFLEAAIDKAVDQYILEIQSSMEVENAD